MWFRWWWRRRRCVCACVFVCLCVCVTAWGGHSGGAQPCGHRIPARQDSEGGGGIAGVTLTNASISSLLSPLNTKSAPSGGDPVAPAHTSWPASSWRRRWWWQGVGDVAECSRRREPSRRLRRDAHPVAPTVPSTLCRVAINTNAHQAPNNKRPTPPKRKRHQPPPSSARQRGAPRGGGRGARRCRARTRSAAARTRGRRRRPPVVHCVVLVAAGGGRGWQNRGERRSAKHSAEKTASAVHAKRQAASTTSVRPSKPLLACPRLPWHARRSCYAKRYEWPAGPRGCRRGRALKDLQIRAFLSFGTDRFVGRLAARMDIWNVEM